MFERYQNVLFDLFWTFQLVNSLFFACGSRVGSPTKALLAPTVTDFRGNSPIYIHLGSICVSHRKNSQVKLPIFTAELLQLVVAHSTFV